MANPEAIMSRCGSAQHYRFKDWTVFIVLFEMAPLLASFCAADALWIGDVKLTYWHVFVVLFLVITAILALVDGHRLYRLLCQRQSGALASGAVYCATGTLVVAYAILDPTVDAYLGPQKYLWTSFVPIPIGLWLAWKAWQHGLRFTAGAAVLFWMIQGYLISGNLGASCWGYGCGMFSSWLS